MSSSQSQPAPAQRTNKRNRDETESPTPQPRTTRRRLAHPLPGIASIAHQITVGSFPLTDAHLPIPATLGAEEVYRRKEMCYAESKLQTENPPVLPQSRVPELPEKPFLVEYAIIPPDAEPMTRKELEKCNLERGQENAKIDRTRNNQAAMKSRNQRIEALNNAKSMLLEKTIESYWLRLRLACEGIDATNAWDNVPDIVKNGMRAQITRDMDRVESERVAEKKAEDARKRKARNEERNTRRKAAGPATTTVQPKPTLSTASP